VRVLAVSDRHYFVDSIARALKVLEVLSRIRRPLKLAEIAAGAEMDSTTAFRVVFTLESIGYLKRDADTKRYSLGWKLLSQGMAALNSSAVVERAQPVIEELFVRSGETADLCIRDGLEAVVVLLNKTPDIVNVYHRVGVHLPLHCCAVGKALLSDCTPEGIREVIGDDALPRVTSKTITDPVELAAEIETVRRKGYAVADQELEPNIRGVAAAVRDGGGRIVAAASLTVTIARMSREEMEATLAPQVVAAAREISRGLGAPAWPDNRPAE
jgi:DNA-binding IclR family transcriptional regulator